MGLLGRRNKNVLIALGSVDGNVWINGEGIFSILDNHIRNWKTSVQWADKHDFKEEEIQKLNMFYW